MEKMNTQTSMLHVRVDDRLKQDATDILDGFGLTISEAARILLTRIVREKSLPYGLVSGPEAYDEWFKQKVQEAMADDRPRVSHQDAMARARGAIAKVSAE